MKIAVIGTGYVGLVSGACFSQLGFDVVCVDQNIEKIKSLESGVVPIYEPGLEKVITDGRAAGHLSFTTDLSSACLDAAAIFIAVGTPTDEKTGQANLAYVFEAGRQIAKHIKNYTVIVIKSTVPVGTSEQLRKIILEVSPDAQFDIASNPEFLREGNAVDDFMQPDRVVIGVGSKKAEIIMRQLYQPLSIQNVPLVITSSASAEMIKYTANCYLAMRIGFVNQVSDVCEAVGADIGEVALGVGLDKRIGQHYFAPGPGIGGSCFPKDTLAMVAIARNHDVSMSIIEEFVVANDKRRINVAHRVAAALGGDVKGKKIAIFGIAFKANTDDIRDSAALVVIPLLQEMGADISAYDPAAMENGQHTFQNVRWCESPFDAAMDADVVVVLTEWKEFKDIDFQKLKSKMRTPLVIDFRNLYQPEKLSAAGFIYHSMGRASSFATLNH
jgi:UDPglucose 6-dehydrogenase